MTTITLPKRVLTHKETLTNKYGSVATSVVPDAGISFDAPAVDSINRATANTLDVFSNTLVQYANTITTQATELLQIQTSVATLAAAKANSVSPTIDNATLNGNTAISKIVANSSLGTTGQYLASGGGNNMYWATFAVAGTPSLDAVVGVGGSTSKAISVGNTTINGTATISQHAMIGPVAGSVTSGNQTSLEIRNNGGTGDGDVAAVSYHCAGYYAVHQHLRADGYFGIGGWSAESWRWYINTTNGDMTAAGNITAYSDPRLKEDVTPIESALAKVLSWNGVRYRWKSNSAIGQPGKYDYGILSPDIAANAPELVVDSVWDSEDGDKYKTVAYQKLSPFLIEAIKEQQGIIDTQQSTIDKLQRQIEDIMNRLISVEGNAGSDL
jgi:hypothetical protein